MIFPGNLILPAENLGCDCVQSSTLVLVRSCFFLNLLGIRGCFFFGAGTSVEVLLNRCEKFTIYGVKHHYNLQNNVLFLRRFYFHRIVACVRFCFQPRDHAYLFV